MENTKVYNRNLVDFDEKQVVYLREFIIYEQEDTKDKYAIFKFFNNYIEELNDVEFTIKQYDTEGVLIAENTLKYSNFKADKKSYFSPYTKLMVEDECHRLEAVLVKATFKKHEFFDNKLSTLKDVENMKRNLKPSRKERNKVKVKKIKNKNKIKYIFLAPFLAIALLVSVLLTIQSVNDFAENQRYFSDENFYYERNDRDELTVTQYLKSDKKVTIVPYVSKFKVTAIKDGVFANSQVEEVTIRADEIAIGNNAFKNCTSLSKISFNNVTTVGDYAFYGCEKLNSFNFKKTGDIGDYAFAGTNITKVVGDSVTSIGHNAFEGCEEITEIEVLNAAISPNAFSSKLVISQISIGDFTNNIGSIFGLSDSELKDHFEIINCKPLTIETGDFDSFDFDNVKLRLDFSIATIDYRSMTKFFKDNNINVIDTTRAEIVDGVLISTKDKGTSELTSSLLNGNSITSISPGVIASVYNDYLLVEIDGVTLTKSSLSRAKFNRLEVGNGVNLSNDVFEGNSLIKELVVTENAHNNYSKILKDAENINTIRYRGNEVLNGYFENLKHIYNVEFLSSHVTIGVDAFKNCENLSVVDFSKIDVINEGAFEGCLNFEVLDFTDNVQFIGKDAFKNCENLREIHGLPNNVDLGKAFSGKNSITSLEIYNYGMPLSSIGDFDGLQTLTIQKNTKNNKLVSNLVSGFDNLHTLNLPEANYIESNVVNKCRNLTFITLYTESNWDSFIGTGCSNLKYVTILGSMNVAYSSFNRSYENTVNLVIHGDVYSSFSLQGTNLNYFKVNNTDAKYLGQLFGAASSKDQGKYVPSNLRTVEIGNTNINSDFFRGCTYLHNIILPNATYISANALSELYSIRNIYFGASYLSSTGFVSGFNLDTHNTNPVIHGNNSIISALRNQINNASFENSNASKTYHVINDGEEVGTFEGLFVYSISEILDRYGLSGSLTFERNSNTPVNVEYYSDGNKIYVFTPEEVKYQSYYSKPITVNYHYNNKRNIEEVHTINYFDKGEHALEYFIPEVEGKLFAGWYTDEKLTKRYDFEEANNLTKSIDLYAKFITEQSKLFKESCINTFSNTSYVYSEMNGTIEIFVYGQAGERVYINGERYSMNEQIIINAKAHTVYEVTTDISKSVSISVIFKDQTPINPTAKVEVKEESYKNFKLDGSSVSNYNVPEIEDYELVGWYNSRGELVIDRYGNVYQYKSTDVYAKWKYIG